MTSSPSCLNPNKDTFFEGLGVWPKWMEGKWPPYWGGLRLYVFRRDKYYCQRCHKRFSAAALDCHHIVPKENGGSDNPKNLLTLCEPCHNAIHDGGIEADCLSGESLVLTDTRRTYSGPGKPKEGLVNTGEILPGVEYYAPEGKYKEAEKQKPQRFQQWLQEENRQKEKLKAEKVKRKAVKEAIKERQSLCRQLEITGFAVTCTRWRQSRAWWNLYCPFGAFFRKKHGRHYSWVCSYTYPLSDRQHHIGWYIETICAKACRYGERALVQVK